MPRTCTRSPATPEDAGVQPGHRRRSFWAPCPPLPCPRVALHAHAAQVVYQQGQLREGKEALSVNYAQAAGAHLDVLGKSSRGVALPHPCQSPQPTAQRPGVLTLFSLPLEHCLPVA